MAPVLLSLSRHYKLFALKVVSKSRRIFQSYMFLHFFLQEIGSLFLNRISVTMLLQNLDAHRMHADIGPVFDKYFSYVVDLTKMGLAKADFIFTEHVVLCTKALYHLVFRTKRFLASYGNFFFFFNTRKTNLKNNFLILRIARSPWSNSDIFFRGYWKTGTISQLFLWCIWLCSASSR